MATSAGLRSRTRGGGAGSSDGGAGHAGSSRRRSGGKSRGAGEAGRGRLTPPSAEESEMESEMDSDKEQEPETKAAPAANAESKLKKIITRTFFGLLMGGGFLFVVWLGHLPCAVFVVGAQIELFRELLGVRYQATREKEIRVPLFRTVQWGWLFWALVAAYGQITHEISLEHKSLHWVTRFTQFHGTASFALFSAMFMVTVLFLRRRNLRYQIGVTVWTLVSCALVVGQAKFGVTNIYNGLFWFLFPACVVVLNDVGAYFVGITCGRRFISRPFLSLSPNKTWEGFLGSLVITVALAPFIARMLAASTWFTCPPDSENWSFPPASLDCRPNPVFVEQEFAVPQVLSAWLPATIHVMPIMFHGLAFGVFASSVAPFGGFFASGVKRAFGKKDFDSFLPGHGGLVDRLDCQLIMIMFTWVYYTAFVRTSVVPVQRLLGAASLLPLDEQQWLHQELGELIDASA